jgi:6-phosphogluconate dehydrogenase
MADFGLYGLGVMGQNFALNVAEHGFNISVCNRSAGRVDTCVKRAQAELGDQKDNLKGYKTPEEFVQSLSKPRIIMFLVQAGAAVDSCIETFASILEPGDILCDGGNEWFENSTRRAEWVKPKGIIYMAMGISGGEEGARKGPSLMPGGPKEGYDAMAPIILKCAAQTNSGPCTTYIGGPGSGNYVKMVHNGIEYGDMQLIAEAYEILKTIGGLSNEELQAVFKNWNKGILDSFLIEITGEILGKKDTQVYDLQTNMEIPEAKGDGYLVDKILDRTGNKGTGKMTIKEGADRACPVGTMAGALDARFISFDKVNRIKLSKLLPGPPPGGELETAARSNKNQLIADVEAALYCSKICSYAQGMNLIRAASDTYNWGVSLGECARIWKGGCIIRAAFLDRIMTAYDKDANLANLLIDPSFLTQIIERQSAWRRVISVCTEAGLPTPSMYASLAYYDMYRRESLDTASLVQAQRDFFGSHTFERKDTPIGKFFHCKWTDAHAIA